MPPSKSRKARKPPPPAAKRARMDSDSAATFVERIEGILDKILGDEDERCYVPNEVGRRTSCTCLRHLLEKHKEQTKKAISVFLLGMDERKGNKGRIERHEKNHKWSRDNPGEPINNPIRPDYELPVEGLPGSKASGPTILVCRATVMELLHRTLVWDRKELKVYFRAGELDKGNERKRKLFALLRFLLKTDWDVDSTVDWNDEELKKIEVAKNTLQDWARPKVYDLRRIASGHVYGVDRKRDLIANTFGGHVCTIPEDVIGSAFPLLSKRRNIEKFKRVNTLSVQERSEKYKGLVHYLVLDRGDGNMRNEINCIDTHLQPIIAGALGAEESCRVESAILISPGFAPQVCHYDFKEDQRQAFGGRLFLGFCPLTESGCYLQVWSPVSETNLTQEGKVLFIPYGCILVLPGDTIHGGGFLSDPETGDLRLHFYIYIRGADNMIQNNVYLSLDDYPHYRGLEQGESLHKLFTSEMKNCGTKTKKPN